MVFFPKRGLSIFVHKRTLYNTDARPIIPCNTIQTKTKKIISLSTTKADTYVHVGRSCSHDDRQAM